MIKNCLSFQDELQTTTKSYENHLSLMSEHIASMNDKLAQQKDEIDALKLQLNTKVRGVFRVKGQSTWSSTHEVEPC